ncbi:hypothetical protein [Phaeovulum sp.]|uniref:hypothetical protein n=1 Tax=Phaeovulum sp. TaxID=2934796 RepID=UPI0039E64F0B
MKSIVFTASIVLALTGCAATSVTPVSKNQVIISTSAAPACGRSGAAKVASKMAAVETVRRGYQRYIIVGANSANNVQAIRTGPTYSNTYANASVYGNTATGSATTYYGGQQTVIFGSNDSDLGVVMFNPGEQGFKNGIDARSELGPDWEKLVKDGIRTCT